MSRLTCAHCQATTEGVVLCKRCRTTAAVSLEAIAANHADLFTFGSTPAPVRRRSGRSDPTGSAASRGDDRGSRIEDAAAETRAMLNGWVQRLIQTKPDLHAPRDVSAMTALLTQHLRTIATAAWAGEFLAELLTYERRLKRLLSGNRGHWYAGICAARTGPEPDDWCPADLFVTPGEDVVRCRGCGTRWSVDQRRAEVIAQARDTLLPVALIARAAVSLLEGEPSQQRLEARLRKWVERGDLDDYGVRVLEGRPRRVYRLGDVIDRLTREVSGIHA